MGNVFRSLLADFDIGLLANTQARLSIFYSDFTYDEKNNYTSIFA
jgi:hypothetical protein